MKYDSVQRIENPNMRIKIEVNKSVLSRELMYYVISRVIFMALALLFSLWVMPYYTYNDYTLYSKVTLKDIEPIYYLRQRQTWIAICAALNSFELFKITQFPRLINICVGWFIVKELRCTMELMGIDEISIRKSVKFIIFFPIFTIFSCSLVKDVIFLWCVWCVINQMFMLNVHQHVSVVKAIMCSVLGMSFRFGVIESLLIIMLGIYIWRSNGRRRIMAIVFAIALTIIAIYFWGITGGYVIFEQKTRIYLGTDNEILGSKTLFGIITDAVLKLFGAGPRLHPQEGKVLWISFLGYLSIFNIYVLYWVFIWLVQCEKQWMEWFFFSFMAVWMAFLSYTGYIIYRQILFLQPALWILCCKARFAQKGKNKMLLCSGAMLISYIIYFIMFIYVRI